MAATVRNLREWAAASNASAARAEQLIARLEGRAHHVRITAERR